MRRPRPKRGERRIDAAIDHLAQCGFAKPRIRDAIHDLLQVYGRDGWVFLEEESYRIVRNKLVEEQAQQNQKLEAAAGGGASPQNGLEVSRVHGDAPNESHSALEMQASANNSPPLKYVLPVPPAKEPCAGPTSYGWISEASETESEVEDAGPVIFVEKDIPNPVETLPS